MTSDSNHVKIPRKIRDSGNMPEVLIIINDMAIQYTVNNLPSEKRFMQGKSNDTVNRMPVNWMMTVQYVVLTYK